MICALPCKLSGRVLFVRHRAGVCVCADAQRLQYSTVHVMLWNISYVQRSSIWLRAFPLCVCVPGVIFFSVCACFCSWAAEGHNLIRMRNVFFVCHTSSVVVFRPFHSFVPCRSVMDVDDHDGHRPRREKSRLMRKHTHAHTTGRAFQHETG